MTALGALHKDSMLLKSLIKDLLERAETKLKAA